MPLMMIGTPGRPGMTRSTPPPARAAGVAPIKRANAITLRMGILLRFLIDNLHQCAQPRVKAGRLLGGKANAKPLTSIQWALRRACAIESRGALSRNPRLRD